MKERILICLILASLVTISVKSQDTFSIVAMDPITGEVGSAGASCVDLNGFGLSDHFLGELFPGLGAINTQAYYIPTNQANARNRMELGDTPIEIIEWLINNDVENQPQFRQYGIVSTIDGVTESAAHTGASTDDYKDHITGPNYAIQGNILLGEEVLNAMEENFLNAEGDLACKLMAALQGANMVGADTRCAPNGTSSLFAFVKVAQTDDSFGDPSFVLSVRTADGDGIEPIDSLQVLFDADRECTTNSINETGTIETAFSFFPNPVNQTVVFENNSLEAKQLEILNVLGQTIYQATLQNDLTLDMANYQSGIYFVRIANENQSYVTKMIKN